MLNGNPHIEALKARIVSLGIEMRSGIPADRLTDRLIDVLNRVVDVLEIHELDKRNSPETTK